MSKYIGTKAVNLSTTSADVTGNADIDGNLTVGGDLTVSGTTITVDHATAQTVDLGDNDKIRLGDGNDLQIYHDGQHSIIQDAGTGDLRLYGNNVKIKNADNTAAYIQGINGAEVNLYYNNALKLATESGGVNIVGTLTSDGLTVGIGDNIGVNPSNGFAIDASSNIDFTSGGVKSLRIKEGDISFFDDSGNAKLFWDASKESVGIGTTSLTPTDGANIELSSATSSRIILDSTGTGGRKYTMASGTNGSLDFYDYDALAYRMRLDHSGNVGIGVTPSSWRSADVALQLAGTAAEYANFVSGGGGVTYGAGWYRDGATNNFKYTFSSLPAGRFDYNYTGSNVFSWHQAAAGTAGNDITFSEAMRIDATGKLLIGKTDTSINVQGHRFDPQGQAQHVGTNDSTLYLNRKSSYGDVANFYYNGSFDGSIQVDNGYINIGSNETRLAFIDSAPKRIIPRKGHSTASDGLIDLGDQGSEFKNLFLSGGVVFGATSGSITSKTLDDYEEGTWTPYWSASGATPTLTYSTQIGRYTKVGDLVVCWARLTHSSISGGTGYARLSGLPFNPSSFEEQAGGQIGYSTAFDAGSTPIAIHADNGVNYCWLYYQSTAAGDINSTPNISSLKSTGSIYFSVVYKVA